MGRQIIAVAVLIAALIVAGCEGARRDINVAMRRHSFESKLFADNVGVPNLEKPEWDEIRDQFALYTEYQLQEAVRFSQNEVVVSLELKTDPFKGMRLLFEKKGSRWIENRSLAEKVEYLMP